MAEVDLSRRHFLNIMVNAVGAGITAVLAAPLAGYFLDPAMRKAGADVTKVKVTQKAKLTTTPQQFTIQTVRKEGFMKQDVNATVYAFLDDQGNPVALSNTCTHLGCPAGWDKEKDKFFCPCHGGVYDKNGKNVAGPPPRPLPQFKAAFEGEDLVIEV